MNDDHSKTAVPGIYPPEDAKPGDIFVLGYSESAIKAFDAAEWTGETWRFHGTRDHSPEMVAIYGMRIIGKMAIINDTAPRASSPGQSQKGNFPQP